MGLRGFGFQSSFHRVGLVGRTKSKKVFPFNPLFIELGITDMALLCLFTFAFNPLFIEYVDDEGIVSVENCTFNPLFIEL